MKKTFLRILPIVAAVLLATSCSKDDNGDVNSVDTPQTTEVPNPTTEQPAETTVKIPFTVKVGGGESLSKIGYALQKDGDNDIWNKVTRTFDDDDLAGGTHPITLTVKGAAEGSGITESAIPLKRDSEGNYYFEGDIEVASEKVSDFNSEPGIALVGEFNVTGTTLPTSSNESLAKLMESCAHTYKTKDGDFTSKSPSVTLYDQNVYLAVQMSPLQHTLDVKIDGTALSDCNLSNEGQVWIALEGDKSVAFNFLEKAATDVAAGYIYTIDRTGFVDLGISDGTLWADANVSGGTGYNNTGLWYYNWDQSKALGVTLPTGGTGADTDLKNLSSQCYWLWGNDGSHNGFYVFKAKAEADKGKKSFDKPTLASSYSVTDDTHIFIPALGCKRNLPNNANLEGLNGWGNYWTSTFDTENDYAYNLAISNGNVNTEDEDTGEHSIQLSVRAVRHK